MRHNSSLSRKRRLLVLRHSNSFQHEESSEDSELELLNTTNEIEEFYEACGGAQSLYVQIKDQQRVSAPNRVMQQRPYLLIGRARDCDIRLRHPDVSYLHAYLQVLNRQVFCIDLGSRTGTHWPSGPRRFGRLETGDSVRVGPYWLQLDVENFGQENNFSATARPVKKENQSSSFANATLEFLNASPEIQQWRLTHTVTLLGRGRVCEVQLSDENISRVHCSLVRTRSGIWVIDLLSRGGTLVDGRPVSCTRLQEGQELQIGEFRIQMKYNSSRKISLLSPRKQQTNNSRKTQPEPFSEPSPVSHSPSQEILNSSSLVPDSRGTSSQPMQPHSSPMMENFSQGNSFHQVSSSRNQQPAGTFSESFVLSLIQEFAAMQQQMFEQAQQTMMTMAHILSTTHENQMDLVREELAQVRKLTQELQLVRSQMEQNRIEQASQETSGFLSEEHTLEEEDSSSPLESSYWESLSSEADRNPERNEESSESERTADEDGKHRQSESPTDHPSAENDEEKQEEQTFPGTKSSKETTPPPSSPDGTEDDFRFAEKEAQAQQGGEETSEDETTDPHAWLCQRMAMLEKERKNHWQRITELLTGARQASRDDS